MDSILSLKKGDLIKIFHDLFSLGLLNFIIVVPHIFV